MIPARKLKLPERKLENQTTRIQLNRYFETQEEMERFVKENHPTATIKQFWPSQVLNCIIEIPCVPK
jgi:hypothetical protein